jgi:hypothetical protein
MPSDDKETPNALTANTIRKSDRGEDVFYATSSPDLFKQLDIQASDFEQHGQVVTGWTQDEAIAFECAREVITHLMAIYSSQIADEASKTMPNTDRLASLRAERSRLAQERLTLHVHDHADVARIRTDYGTIILAHRFD